MGIFHQLKHLQIDDDEPDQLPENVVSHVFCQARGCGRVIGLLVRLPVGLIFHKFSFSDGVTDQSGSSRQPGSIRAW
jgi:hypothetical protein